MPPIAASPFTIAAPAAPSFDWINSSEMRYRAHLGIVIKSGFSQLALCNRHYSAIYHARQSSQIYQGDNYKQLDPANE